MIRHLGARAIADACHVSIETVYRWRKAQLRGEQAPLAIRSTVTGRIWASEADVEAYYGGPMPPNMEAESANLKALRRMGFA